MAPHFLLTCNGAGRQAADAMQGIQKCRRTPNTSLLLSSLAVGLLVQGAYGSISLTTVVSFDSTNGATPEATLSLGKDGWLYGTTLQGGIYRDDGSHGHGTVFKVSTNGLFTSLVSFNGTNGGNPQAGVVASADGSLYGTTGFGGAANIGTVFQLSTNGALSTLAAFDGNTGCYPKDLLLGNNGEFYGTAYWGGDTGYGTVFKVTTNGVLSLLASFDGTNGSHPQAPLFQSADGTLYGTTVAGGSAFSVNDLNDGFGTIFKVNTNGLLTSLASFNQTNGALPTSGLVQGPGRCLYGLADSGGVYLDAGGSPVTGDGTLFKVTMAGQLSVAHMFLGYPLEGACPEFGRLTRGRDGNYYGLTQQGGAFGRGVLFQMTGAGRVMPLVSFKYSDGVGPVAGLTEAGKGIFYGVTLRGGAYDLGTVFRFSMRRPFYRPVVSIRRSLSTWQRSDGMMTLQGRAWGKQALQGVLVQFNGGNWYAAGTTNQWKNWTAQQYFLPGNYTIRACAVDAAGVVSLTETVRFHLF